MLGDVTFSGDFLDMRRVGDLDVDLVVHAEVGCLIVPKTALRRFIQSGSRHGRTCFSGAEDIWDAIR